MEKRKNGGRYGEDRRRKKLVKREGKYMERRLTLAGRSPGTRIDSSPIEPSRADRLIADVQSGVVYIVVNFIGTRGKEGRRKISIAKRKQLAATLADKTPNTGRGGSQRG